MKKANWVLEGRMSNAIDDIYGIVREFTPEDEGREEDSFFELFETKEEAEAQLAETYDFTAQDVADYIANNPESEDDEE